MAGFGGPQMRQWWFVVVAPLSSFNFPFSWGLFPRLAAATAPQEFRIQVSSPHH